MVPNSRVLPLFPLNVVLFPRMTLPLRIFEPRYLQMIDECVHDDGLFGVVYIREGEEVGGPAIPFEVGTTARIVHVEGESPNLLHITTVGQERFVVRRLLHEKPYLVGEVDPYPLTKVDAPEVGALVDAEIALLAVYLDLLTQVSDVQIRMQHQFFEELLHKQPAMSDPGTCGDIGIKRLGAGQERKDREQTRIGSAIEGV